MKPNKKYYYVSKQKYSIGSYISAKIVYDTESAAMLDFLRNSSGDCYIHTLQHVVGCKYEVKSVEKTKVFT